MAGSGPLRWAARWRFRHCWPGGCPAVRRNGTGGRSDQDRRAAFAVRHHGDQRDDAEGHHPDDGGRHQQEGRPARQEGRGGRGRSGVQLAAVRRKGAGADPEGQGRGGVRLLDLGVSRKSVLPVFEETERPAVLSRAVRGRGDPRERLLHRRRAQPAGDPGGRIPDGSGRRIGQALGAGRHRLCLSAHDQQDPGSLPDLQGRARRTTS